MEGSTHMVMHGLALFDFKTNQPGWKTGRKRTILTWFRLNPKPYRT